MDERSLERHVIHGPFPARLGLVGTAAATCILGVAFVFLGMMSQRLECGVEVDAMCTLDKRPAFYRGDIRALRVDIERGSKNSKYGIVVVQLARGPEQRLMRVDPDDANEAMGAIRAAQSAQAPIDVTLHQPKFLTPLGVAALIASVVSIVMALSRMGRFDLIVSPDGSTLDVRRSLYGVPLGTKAVPLYGVERVVIERGMLSPRFRSATNQPISVARLRLETRSQQLPLSRNSFPGNALHLRAASALRAALSLPPDVQDDATLAAIPMRTTALGQRILFAWIGVTSGSMLGLAIFGITMLLLGKTSMRSNIEDWMFAVGAIPGAIAGAAIVFHATRTRLAR